jgi:3-phenylpropionate/trans-cinnamate dioxygenase ferredoxin reductase subunit
VLGAGVAAACAAETLRSAGFDGRLVIIGAERDLPYNRPALSKERLRGEVTDEQTLLHTADRYRELDVELALDRKVTRVDLAARRIDAQEDVSWDYDKLLVATGARPRRMDGATALDGIYYLRSLADCRMLSDTLRQRPRVLVVGTGFIGCEVAASARALGCEVTIAGRRGPLAHVLGDEIGNIYSAYHRSHGVDVREGVSVARFDGDGKVERATLSDGSTVPCDAAIVGIGVTPVVDMLQGQAIAIDNGILVDEFCQTNLPAVFAAGDVASSWNPRFGTRIRVEHFDNAQRQAAVAAKAMLGATEPYNPIPSFWSDQFSYGLQYRGYASSWDSVVVRGKPDEASFTAFYLSNGMLLAACSINRYKENSAARKLIGKPVDPRALQDDAVDLSSLVPAPPANH